MTLSTLSTMSMEDVAAASRSQSNGSLPPLWFQLYVNTNKQKTEQLVHRAEAAGYRALVVTVDAPVLGRREADIRNGFKIPSHLSLGNFTDELGTSSSTVEAVDAVTTANQREEFNKFFAGLISKNLTWKDILWLKSITTLKIVVKGILTVTDALHAVEAGVDG
jgi:isopentenyl diphosphate isomerase/L-lactate dehydrogenase-like FMN-dependent dehydrogenase